MRSSKPEVKILDNSEEVAREAAGEIMGLAREAHRVKGLIYPGSVGRINAPRSLHAAG